MKPSKAFVLAAGILISGLTSVSAYIYNFTTIAGTAGTSGGNDSPDALFNYPMGIAINGTSTNIYVADYGNSTIREIAFSSGSWYVSTIAGIVGTPGTTDNTIGALALFNNPTGIAINGTSANIYVADYGNNTIREIVPLSGTWFVSTIAGMALTTGSDDGYGSAALFYSPASVAVDSAGNVYVADSGNNTIRQITTVGGSWLVSTIAGKAGKSGSADGTNSTARFYTPTGVAVDSMGNVYVTDGGNNTIRMIIPVPGTTNWVVSTIAGKAGKNGNTDGTNNATRFYQPHGLAVDASNNLYVSDAGNDVIRKITPVGANWVVTTIAGTAGKSGSANGTGSSARFNMPMGVTTDSSGNVYVADTYNDTIRQGLALPATFVPVQGTYNGLAIQTNAPSQESVGSLKLVLTETGTFAANLTMGGTRAAFGGQFDQSGNWINTVTGSGSSPWQVILHLDLTNGTEEITGTVSNSASPSELVADLAVFSKAYACPQTGVYTFVVMPPSGNDTNLPQGWGYGTLTIAPTGSGKLSGMLGDGTKLTGTVPISKYGTGPLYNVLYGGKGSCVGWLSFTSNAIESTVDWFKPPVHASHFYPAGFTNNVVTLLGSKYVAPAKGSPMLSLTNTVGGNITLALGGGNLGAALSNSVAVATNNTVTILSGSVTNLTLKLVPKNGMFSGSFLHPVTHKSVKFQGAVLQLQDFGAGFFAGTNETGYVTFNPAE